MQCPSVDWCGSGAGVVWAANSVL